MGFGPHNMLYGSLNMPINFQTAKMVIRLFDYDTAIEKVCFILNSLNTPNAHTHTCPAGFSNDVMLIVFNRLTVNLYERQVDFLRNIFFISLHNLFVHYFFFLLSRFYNWKPNGFGYNIIDVSFERCSISD